MSKRLFSNDSNHAEGMFKTVIQFFGVAFAIWIAWALICLSILGGIVYVAWHFIAKVW